MSDNSKTSPMLCALAMCDLEKHFEGMPRGTRVAVSMAIETLPPAKWDAWVKEKLCASESANYWKAVFENAK